MHIVVWYGGYFYVGYILQCALFVISMFDVYINVLCRALLCWMYIAVSSVCQYNVGCILQCAMVFNTLLDEYCSVLC